MPPHPIIRVNHVHIQSIRSFHVFSGSVKGYSDRGSLQPVLNRASSANECGTPLRQEPDPGRYDSLCHALLHVRLQDEWFVDCVHILHGCTEPISVGIEMNEEECMWRKMAHQS